MKYYEIFLNKKDVLPSSWENFILNISAYLGIFKTFKVVVTITNHKIRYFLITKQKLPLSFNNSDFLLKNIPSLELKKYAKKRIYFNNYEHNLIDIINKFEKSEKNIQELVIKFWIVNKKYIFKKANIYYQEKDKLIQKRLFWVLYSKLLSIDFESEKSYFYEKVPKYLNIEKILHLLTDNKEDSLLKVETFPYLEDKFYLKHNSYDFFKHSLVLGSSGSGKSKFLALLISLIYKYNKDNQKVVVIDPHNALKNELGAILSKKIIDFKTDTSSINLFKNNIQDINSTLELTLSIFKSLINDQYNSRLERVLRYSLYLLIEAEVFTFFNLKKLLVDLDYRNSLLNEFQSKIPSSVASFFLTDFNELKRECYSEAIAPIISFIDEMQMIPIFNQNNILTCLSEVIKNNFLTVFSLDRLNLGDKVTKTIAGFIMEQLFTLAESRNIFEHLIFIIDEVAVIENPILARFLAELRKFNTSLILSGQYFSQISSELKNAIFANVNNYYLFRVSKNDAVNICDNIEIKLANSDKLEDNYKMLTNLKNRECLIRLSKNGVIYPTFKARTCDFIGESLINEEIENKSLELLKKEFDFNFSIDSTIKIKDIMQENSASRKRLENEK